MTKRLATTGTWQERLLRGARHKGKFAKVEIRHIESSCEIFLPGHTVHWIQAKKSLQAEQQVICASSIVVHDDGLVDIEGSGLKVTLWNHDPGRLRRTLNAHARRAVWKPRFHVLVVPGPDGYVFNMARPDERSACKRRARAREGEPAEEYALRAMREDGGYVVGGFDLLPRDAAKVSAKSGDEGTSTASSE